RGGFKMGTVEFDAGEICLLLRHFQRWVGTADQEHLTLSISDAALMGACDGVGKVELQHWCRLLDKRLSALVAAVNQERIAGFASGCLFLDSIEQALAVALVNGYALRRRSVRAYRGGLGPARLRRIKELVHAKIEDELTLEQMAVGGVERSSFLTDVS